VANKVAQALGRKFLVYDASKAMFEDVLGYPNVSCPVCSQDYVLNSSTTPLSGYYVFFRSLGPFGVDFSKEALTPSGPPLFPRVLWGNGQNRPSHASVNIPHQEFRNRLS
jgi:hypothetical protein